MEFGRHLGSQLRGQELVLLCGELGTGKTLLVKGIAAALGVPAEEVTSPSFVLMTFYRQKFGLFHFDLYRLGELARSGDVGLDEHLGQGVLVVEWAQYLDPGYFQMKEAIVIRLTAAAEGERRIEVETALRHIRRPS